MSQCYICGKESNYICERCKKPVCNSCTITLTNQRLLTTKYFCSDCSEKRFKWRQGFVVSFLTIACLALLMAFAALVIAVIVWYRSRFN